MLAEIEMKIKKCKKCDLWKSRNKAVAGEGPANAKIMLVGEAPGKKEDECGKPFVGWAGKQLDKILVEEGFERKNFFITSIIKCRPPSNRMPKKEEIESCMPYLKEQIKTINPKIILLLGLLAAKSLLGEKIKSINKIRGKQFFVDGIIYIPTYHPASLRFPKNKSAFIHDIRLLRKYR